MRYRALFVQHGVGLSDAALIDHARLRDMGITLVGHRIKILKALHDLRSTLTPKRTEEIGISIDGKRGVAEEVDKRDEENGPVILKHDAWLATTSSDRNYTRDTHKKAEGHARQGEKKKKRRRRRESENGETSDITKRKNRRKESNAHDVGAQSNIIADPSLLPDGQLIGAKARKETNEQSRKRKTAVSTSMSTTTSDMHLEKLNSSEENALPLRSKRQKPCTEPSDAMLSQTGKGDEGIGAQDEGGINDEIRAAVAAAAEEIKLSNDSDNEEDLSGSESEEEEEEKVDSYRTSCSLPIPLQQGMISRWRRLAVN